MNANQKSGMSVSRMSSTENRDVVNDVVNIVPGSSGLLLVCEHASAYIPLVLNDLGLPAADRFSHAVWDPGALEVARGVAQIMDATLVASEISRLVYDCNRPPEAPDAMPHRSERIDVPGNAGLDAAVRAERVARYYLPFRQALAEAIADQSQPVIVTIHSFTPIYQGQQRSVEIGILHDSDTRLADVLLALGPQHTDLVTRRNAPYGPEDGVTHTLKEHAITAGFPNVMIEIRNDLIQTPEQQSAMARLLSGWLAAALEAVKEERHA